MEYEVIQEIPHGMSFFSWMVEHLVDLQKLVGHPKLIKKKKNEMMQ